MPTNLWRVFAKPAVWQNPQSDVFGQRGNRMEQPIPEVTDKDVERIILRDFGKTHASKALAILQEYGKQEWNRPGSPRVRLAILKLANGNLNQLEIHTKVAIQDFRDVLSAAEYPRYAHEIGFDMVSEKKIQEIVESDWQQYNKWLERK